MAGSRSIRGCSGRWGGEGIRRMVSCDVRACTRPFRWAVEQTAAVWRLGFAVGGKLSLKNGVAFLYRTRLVGLGLSFCRLDVIFVLRKWPVSVV